MSTDRRGNARVKYRRENAADARQSTVRRIQNAGFLVIRPILPPRPL
jgi:hypothetical protein